MSFFNKVVLFILLLFCIMLIALQINSSTWLRMRLAQHYKNKHEYANSIFFYNKILAKNSAKKGLSATTLSEINLSLGNLYAKLGLKNLAVESYAATGAEISSIDLRAYYERGNFQNDLLIAIGMLESARFDIALKEFQFLKDIYPDFTDIEKYITAANGLKKEDITQSVDALYFLIGDAYISNQLFIEAKAFFSKRILDYGLDLIDTLSYLSNTFSNSDAIRKSVWGDNIFVVLEDFECIDTKLARWICGTKSRIIDHFIIQSSANKGNLSEALKVIYTKKEYDFWAKNTKFLLNSASPNLGLRTSIKSTNPSFGKLYFRVIYPMQGVTGVCTPSAFCKDIGNGWVEYSIKDLYRHAKNIADARDWNADEVVLDKIIIDTEGVPCEFLIDNIELFIVEKQVSLLAKDVL